MLKKIFWQKKLPSGDFNLIELDNLSFVAMVIDLIQ